MLWRSRESGRTIGVKAIVSGETAVVIKVNRTIIVSATQFYSHPKHKYGDDGRDKNVAKESHDGDLEHKYKLSQR